MPEPAERPNGSVADIQALRLAPPARRTHPELVWLVSAEAVGDADEEQRALLAARPEEWRATVVELLEETADALDDLAGLPPDLADMAKADLLAEQARLRVALRRAVGEAVAPAVALQGTWSPNGLLVWAGGQGLPPADADRVADLARSLGGDPDAWEPDTLRLPDGTRAAALRAPVESALGWLVALNSAEDSLMAGPGLRWLSTVAAWATELVSSGLVVPALSRRRQRRGPDSYEVHWIPAALDADRLAATAAAMPGSVTAGTPSEPQEVCRTVLGAVADAICRRGASMLVTPAIVEPVRTREAVGEAVIARLAGGSFRAESRAAEPVSDALAAWARSVTTPHRWQVVIALDAPEESGGWLLHVDVTGVDRHRVSFEQALVRVPKAGERLLEETFTRLERIAPVLSRPGLARRGQVMLSGDEAWEFLTSTGPRLAAAGFEVAAPLVDRRRPTPRLAVRAEAAGPSQVGAAQLCDVRWSVLLGDSELDADQLRALAAQSRPLVRSKGKWVAIDHADLAAAADALASRSGATRMTGAALLRAAVGLDGGALGATVAVSGSGWAADILRGTTESPPRPLPAPEGFVGELRDYQAEARGWLAFLDRAGLGGCLAMDMGLGKTPTVLAHLLERAGEKPSIAVVPLAVLDNWRAEARRFTPSLKVLVHHGPTRLEGATLTRAIARADLVVTTYGTAVRDMDLLDDVDWDTVVVDEAQLLKNPASETAVNMRRLKARSRLALTGTPVENGLGDLWAILDFTNPGLVGDRSQFVEALSRTTRGAGSIGAALEALNGLLLFRRTKMDPAIAAELPDKIDRLEHCGLTAEQAGLYQAVLDEFFGQAASDDPARRNGQILAAITALKQICDHPVAYRADGPLAGRSGKLARLLEILHAVFAAGEKMLVFTHFASWGEKLARYLGEVTGRRVDCYHGGLSRADREEAIRRFQQTPGPGVLVLSIKAGGTGLNLTAASHVVLYDRWWNPAVEDQARDRAWRIGQDKTVVSHRLVCPGTVDERVEEVVEGKRKIADLVLPKSSKLSDLDAEQLRTALGLRSDAMVQTDASDIDGFEEGAA
ncbi:MAG TPA: DEAD/DEAH box helicase [Acidimicrobiales bacterium]|nr:DEAD/DEAH box helicase [Acidimicrobiales bacterium]